MLRPGDIAGRIGGEEFSIYLNGIQDEAQLQHVIDTLLERLRTIRLPQLQKTLTISIDCCLVEHAQVCFHDVYERSEQALYRAKEKCRNQAVVCTAAYFKTCKPAICIACKSIKYSRFFVIPS